MLRAMFVCVCVGGHAGVACSALLSPPAGKQAHHTNSPSGPRVELLEKEACSGSEWASQQCVEAAHVHCGQGLCLLACVLSVVLSYHSF